MTRLPLFITILFACSETATEVPNSVETPAVTEVSNPSAETPAENPDPFSGLERFSPPASFQCHPSAQEGSCDDVEICCAVTDCFVKIPQDTFRCKTLACTDEVTQVVKTVCN